MTSIKFIQLGSTPLRVSELGIGTWSWGERAWGEVGEGEREGFRAAFETARNAGVNFFDTAEVYGDGESERILGSFVRASGTEVLIATKYAPRRSRAPGLLLGAALRRSLSRLGRQTVDLYQIHWYNRLMVPRLLARSLASAVRDGHVRAVGVSNYGADRMRRFHDEMSRYGVALASNQVEYSLLHRNPETDGVIDACRERGATLIAYSPLAMGVLTGKYSAEHPPPGFRSGRYSTEYLARIPPLLDLMREIGRAHGGRTPSQIALNWLIGKGVLPIPGAKDARQAEEICGAAGWRLSPEEAASLEELSNLLRH